MAIAPEQVILFSGAAARRSFVSNEYCSSVRGEIFFMKGWALNISWFTGPLSIFLLNKKG
jgi:hypothetical protein